TRRPAWLFPCPVYSLFPCQIVPERGGVEDDSHRAARYLLRSRSVMIPFSLALRVQYPCTARNPSFRRSRLASRRASWITALTVLPSSRAISLSSLDRVGGREIVFLTAVPMASPPV